MTKYKSVIRSICFAATSIALLIFNPVSVNAHDFSVGLKSGIVLSRISSIDKCYSYSQNEGYPKYAYPPGLYAALFGEVRFFKNISIISELGFLKTTAKITITTSTESIPEKKYYGTYFRLPLIVKYQPAQLFMPYFLCGVDVGYLIKARCKEMDLFDKRQRSFEMTNDLQTIDFSAIVGFGSVFKICNQSFLWEARLGLGLTKYTSLDGRFLKSWKNNVLMLAAGIVL